MVLFAFRPAIGPRFGNEAMNPINPNGLVTIYLVDLRHERKLAMPKYYPFDHCCLIINKIDQSTKRLGMFHA
jgi:hypothetical protein